MPYDPRIIFFVSTKDIPDEDAYCQSAFVDRAAITLLLTALLPDKCVRLNYSNLEYYSKKYRISYNSVSDTSWQWDKAVDLGVISPNQCVMTNLNKADGIILVVDLNQADAATEIEARIDTILDPKNFTIPAKLPIVIVGVQSTAEVDQEKITTLNNVIARKRQQYGTPHFKLDLIAVNVNETSQQAIMNAFKPVWETILLPPQLLSRIEALTNAPAYTSFWKGKSLAERLAAAHHLKQKLQQDLRKPRQALVGVVDKRPVFERRNKPILSLDADNRKALEHDPVLNAVLDQ